MIDFDAIEQQLTAACDQYEKTAPMVATVCNELYINLHEAPEHVTIADILWVKRLYEDGQWMHPNYAQNSLLHLCNRLGRSTAGMADY